MKQYLDLLRDIMVNGESHQDRTGVGTKSVFGRQIKFDLQRGFPLMTTKKIPLRWIAEELRWFLSGSSSEADLRAQGVDIWKEWADKKTCAKFDREEGDLGPVYGVLWRNFPVGWVKGEHPNHPKYVDQINNLLSEMKNNPSSRRLIVSGWHPYYQGRVALPPCHTLWQIKCHGNTHASLHLYARSIDSFLGLPFNIASYALLLSLLCKLTHREPRDLIISFGDVHIYNNHFTQVEEQLSREPRELPKLVLVADNIFDWEALVQNYDPHPAIKADVAI
jgi:thymidylate synthase